MAEKGVTGPAPPPPPLPSIPVAIPDGDSERERVHRCSEWSLKLLGPPEARMLVMIWKIDSKDWISVGKKKRIWISRGKLRI
jgi:hypothetical protein